MKFPFLLFILLTLFAFSFSNCNLSASQAGNTSTNKNSQKKPTTPAEKLLAKTLAAHGGKLYDSAHFSFTFRKKQYTFKNDNGNFRYTAEQNKEGKTIVDVLENGNLKRTIDGVAQDLTPKQISSYTGGLNSVIYFATLPHKLLDSSVNTAYAGKTTINGKNYEILSITFDEENGGTDFDDEFYYWINQETHFIDFLAYNYKVNKGGVRFRSAYNPRTVGGIRFQDYVNYKAAVGTPLGELPALFEKKELEKLSLIESESVVEL